MSFVAHVCVRTAGALSAPVESDPESPLHLTALRLIQQVIMDHMADTRELTTEHVKSHLQKYRLHSTRCVGRSVGRSVGHDESCGRVLGWWVDARDVS